MTRYWLFVPYFSDPTYKFSALFDEVWDFDLRNNVTAMGWNELGDYSKLSKPELREFFDRTYPGSTVGNTTSTVNVLWDFYHSISINDQIIARKGRKKIIGIGTVTGKAFYDKEKGTERINHPVAYFYPNFLPVQWESVYIPFDEIVFGMRTLYELDEWKYRSLIQGKV